MSIDEKMDMLKESINSLTGLSHLEKFGIKIGRRNDWKKALNKCEKLLEKFKGFSNIKKDVWSGVIIEKEGFYLYEKDYICIICPNCTYSNRIDRTDARKYLYTVTTCKNCYKPIFVEMIRSRWNIKNVLKLNKRHYGFCSYCDKVMNPTKDLPQKYICNCDYGNKTVGEIGVMDE